MAFDFIPTYSDFGTSINPVFRERTCHILANYFGYDFDELEETCLEYEKAAVAEGETATDGFMSFLLEAIECDLGLETEDDF